MRRHSWKNFRQFQRMYIHLICIAVVSKCWILFAWCCMTRWALINLGFFFNYLNIATWIQQVQATTDECTVRKCKETMIKHQSGWAVVSEHTSSLLLPRTDKEHNQDDLWKQQISLKKGKSGGVFWLASGELSNSILKEQKFALLLMQIQLNS